MVRPEGAGHGGLEVAIRTGGVVAAPLYYPGQQSAQPVGTLVPSPLPGDYPTNFRSLIGRRTDGGLICLLFVMCYRGR